MLPYSEYCRCVVVRDSIFKPQFQTISPGPVQEVEVVEEVDPPCALTDVPPRKIRQKATMAASAREAILFIINASF